MSHFVMQSEHKSVITNERLDGVCRRSSRNFKRQSRKKVEEKESHKIFGVWYCISNP